MSVLTGLLIALSGTASFQGDAVLDKKLALDIRATRVERLLQDLGPKCGIELSALEPMKQEVVILRCQDRPAKEILDRLAEALHAEWEVKDGRRTLKRSKETQKALDEIAFRKKVEALKPQLEAYERELKSLPTPYERARATLAYYENLSKGIRPRWEVGQVNLQDAAGILLKQLIVGFGPDGLAKIPWGHIETFATQPLPSERVFNPTQLKAIAEFGQTLEALSEIAKDDKTFPDSWDLKDYHALLKLATAQGGVGKVLLTFIWAQGRLSINVRVYGKDGSDLSGAGANLMTNEEFEPFSENKVELPPTETALPMEGNSVELQRLLSKFPEQYFGFDYPGPEGPVSQEIRKALLDPDRIEPLSFGTSDAVLSSFSVDGRPFLAVVPDASFRASMEAFRDGVLDLGVFRRRSEELGMRTKESGGWVLVLATNPAYCEWRRLSRSSLGKMMRLATQARELTLRHYCRMYFESAHAVRGARITTAFVYLMPSIGIERGNLDVATADAGFVGSLSDLQWRRLLDGAPIDATTLAPDQQAWFRDLVHSGMSFNDQEADYKQVDPSAPKIPALLYRGPEWMPNGIPKGTSVQLRVFDETHAQLVDREPGAIVAPAEGTTSSAGMVAFVACQSVSAKATKTMEEALKGKWRFGKRDAYRLEVRSPHGILLERIFRGTKRFSKDAPLLQFADWPTDFKDEVRREYDRRLKELSGG